MRFLKKRSIGLDIADHTIEVVELEQRGKTVSIRTKARVSLAPGIVEHGRVLNAELLAKTIRELFSATHPTALSSAPIVFGLPESQVYTHTLRFSDIQPKKIQELVADAIAKVVPIPREDLIYSTLTTMRTGSVTEVVIVATHREVLKEWQDFFANSRFSVDIFESETIASFRDLFENSVTEPACVVDIGATTTYLSFFDTHGLRYTRTFFVAGEEFSRSIAASLDDDYEKAEEMKKTVGLSSASQRKKWRASLQIKVDEVATAVQETIAFFEKTRDQKVAEVIVIGGSAQLPELLSYMGTKLSCPVRIGKSILAETPLEYIEAVGLARFALEDNRWKRRDPIFPVIKNRGGKGKLHLSRKWFIVGIVGGLFIFVILGLVLFNQLQRLRKTEPVFVADIPVTVPSTSPTSTESEVSTKSVFKILDDGEELTPVLEEPYRDSPILTEAEPGEEFPFLGTSEDEIFVQVSLDAETTGWIAAEQGTVLAPQ